MVLNIRKVINHPLSPACPRRQVAASYPQDRLPAEVALIYTVQDARIVRV